MKISSIRRVVVLVVLMGLTLSIPFGVTAQTDGADGELRVMSYNIKHAQGNDDCRDPEVAEGEIPEIGCAVDLERTAELIQDYDPDIVALQEVDRFWARSGSVDQPEGFASLLDMDVCFGANLDHEPDDHANEPHQYGVAILSKYPTTSCENMFLPTTEDWEQRGLLEARVDVPGIGEVAVLNTHFQSNASGEAQEAARQRTEQAETVAGHVAGIDVPVVLMGDFNAEPGDDELASLETDQSGLTDAWVAGGDGSEGLTRPAHPEEEPEVRIDLILVSSDFTVNHAEVIVNDDTRITADHFPVIADLSLNDAATPVASPMATPVAG